MRRILVTGANRGIGLALVKAILQQHDDTFVFMGCRDRAQAEAARDAVRSSLREGESSAGERVSVLTLDVASDTSVAELAENLKQACGDDSTPLYGVVNNAGVGSNDRTLRDVLAVNTFGMRRVCEACLPLLDPSKGRIVNITSASGPNFVSECSPERQRLLTDPNIEWNALQAFIDECLAIEGKDAFAARGLGSGDAYGLSKACANSYTLLLARTHPNLHINACTPGFIETDMTRPYAAARGKTPQELGMRSPAEGTLSAMVLLFGERKGNGHYYGSDAERSPLDRYRAPGTEPFRG